MEETDQPVRPRKSPWPLAVATILLTVLTWYLMLLYGFWHWQILVPSRTRIFVEMIDLCRQSEWNALDYAEEPGSIPNDDLILIPPETCERIKQLCRKRGWSGPEPLLLPYHLTGLMALILSLVTFSRKPRGVGCLALVFGLFGLLLSLVFM